MAHDIFKTIKARITKSYNENAKLHFRYIYFGRKAVDR